MGIYYFFWIEVAVMFIIVYYYAVRYLNDERDRKIAEAEKRVGSLTGKGVQP